MKTCMLIGHNSKDLIFTTDTNNKNFFELKNRIVFLLDEKIKNGITHFLIGITSLNMLYYTSEIIFALKQNYPEILLDAILPYSFQLCKMTQKQIIIYNELLKLCNNISILYDNSSENNRHKINQYLIEHSNYIIAIWNGTSKRVGKIIKEAISRNLPVTVLHPSTFSVQNI